MTAHDSFERIEAVKAFGPHAILLDNGPAGPKGSEVAAALRDHASCRDALPIAVSGSVEAAACQRSRRAGIHHHFAEALDFDQFDETWATLVDGRAV